MALIIKMLLENRLGKGKDKLLQVKPGLSLVVEDETCRVLFDTGPDGSFLHNAQRMGVSLSNLTATVLSHGHYDHCGGVPWLPDNSRIICHPQVGQTRYSALSIGGHRVKVKKLSREIDYSRHRMEYSRQPLAISERLMWSGEIAVARPRAYGVLAGLSPAEDYIADEGVLIYRSTRGLIIICGCGHRGLINTLRHCQKVTGVQQIYAIIGGLHLRRAPPWRIRQIKQFLHQQKVEKVMACHCTGSWGRWWLSADSAPATGDTLVLDQG
ncbi:TPA: MBL fold metallo-hydrolase [Klebsiella oxytoca]|nr:MBL fold metallo-hydrolase [Klebsiella oxytoca]